ncbi:MAG: hypothetical protein ACTH31_11020 [Pseudoclavibacter sp.]
MILVAVAASRLGARIRLARGGAGRGAPANSAGVVSGGPGTAVRPDLAASPDVPSEPKPQQLRDDLVRRAPEEV